MVRPKLIARSARQVNGGQWRSPSTPLESRRVFGRERMDLEPWDPWREFERVRDQVDGLLKSFFAKVRQVEKSRPITFFPDTDVVETADDIRIFLSLPGLVEEDIEIADHGGVLVVCG